MCLYFRTRGARKLDEVALLRVPARHARAINEGVIAPPHTDQMRDAHTAWRRGSQRSCAHLSAREAARAAKNSCVEKHARKIFSWRINALQICSDIFLAARAGANAAWLSCCDAWRCRRSARKSRWPKWKVRVLKRAPARSWKTGDGATARRFAAMIRGPEKAPTAACNRRKKWKAARHI